MSDSSLVTEQTAQPLHGDGAAPEPAPTGSPARPARRLSPLGLALDVLLLALIAVGIYFRFSWVNWNQDTDLHPDEYGLTGTITQLRIPDTLGEYFNTRISPISPYQKYDEFGQPLPRSPEYPVPDNRMRWGQWPITIIRYVAERTGSTGYRELRLLGRRLSATADTLTLAVIFIIGWKLYGRRAGLLAAALSALAVMQIQQSHFMTADNFAGLFTALAMLSAVVIAQDTGAAKPRPHTWLWYALFGVFFGMALASRINLAPLLGEVLVASALAYWPLLEKNRSDWTGLLFDAGWRLMLAGAAAFLAFRVTQPMSFRAETGDTTILTLRPNPEWVESMNVAAAESSGVGGGPPGEQWTNRPALVFPWLNMVLWGMGLPLGLLAWAGLLWAAWQSAWPNESDDHQASAWRRHLLPLTWAGGYFLFMGTRWVKSVRYFLPIYPFMALFAAFAVLELWRFGDLKAKRALGQGKEGNNGLEGNGELEGTQLRQQPVSPSSRLSLFSRYHWASLLLGALVLTGTLAWAYAFTSIYRTENTRLQASRWIFQNVPGPLNLHLQTAEGEYTEPLPAPYGISIGTGAPYAIPFTARESGVVTRISAPHLLTQVNPLDEGTLRVVLAADPAGTAVLAQADLTAPADPVDPRGGPAEATLQPASLVEGNTYYVLVSLASGGAVELRGATVAHEEWDEPIPVRFDGRDPFGGLYRGLTMPVRHFENEEKRALLLQYLNEADYVFLPSQRGLWSVSRLPSAYPMTMEYYRALFDGRLGFEQVAEFQSPIRLGPLQISDVAGTWAWGEAPPLPPPGEHYPFNNNPLAAEEAFSVYDHAPVWVFKKRADYSPEQAAAVLNAIDLRQVVNLGPREATAAPTALRLPPARLAEQYSGGTWSEMFDFDGLLNRVQLLGVSMWYLTLILIGALAFPLAFTVFGGLSDRGYALSKTLALLVVTWLVWMAGSFRVLPFTRGTIALGFLALAAVSALIYWRRRGEINAFLSANGRYILIVEALALGLFVFDLLIRLGNPDLWHPSYGGEKPMVFSYFNAVLKSTSFPPYNPWLAGYYLNYYYYGFVIVGLLTKLLGIVPAFAYNLILPTLFSLAGINAFCVAYNLVEGTRRKAQGTGEGAQGTGLKAQDPEIASPPQSAQEASAFAEVQSAISNQQSTIQNQSAISNQQSAIQSQSAIGHHPYLAGIAAALMLVVLGNLGQVHTFLSAFQRAADVNALAGSFLGDGAFGKTLNGLWRVAIGQTTLPVHTGAWYWDASRIITILNGGGGNEITEFPFFTFLYADLHAHMIDLPFVLLSLGWALAVLLSARDGVRRRWLGWAATFVVGGLALGVPRAANTWDFPLFLTLGVLAVVAAPFVRDPRLTRANLLAAGLGAVVLAGLAIAFYQPFETWFAPAYSEVKRYQGPYATLSGYLYVHGLFLFILASYLAWETRRWLAETPATVLSRAGEWLPIVILIALGLIIAVFAFNTLGIEAGVVALPLMAWAGLLLLRSREALSLPRRVVLFLLGTALAITLFVEVFALEGDRMNTIFKFYIQVWTLLSVAAGAALAWLWAVQPAWRPGWRNGWTVAVALLFGAAALYTVTATAAKIRDRFPAYTAGLAGCLPLPTQPLPYQQGLPVEDQPHSLYGLDFMTWSAYCDREYFLPLVYDHDAIRWLQDNVEGSPVIVEAQTFDLYRMGNRYAWNTGLPNVVGWDWHTRQHNAAIPTGFVTERGHEIISFYITADLNAAMDFLRRYGAAYVIVGPMEQAYYGNTGGLLKFDVLVSRGQLAVAYKNPGVTIYEVVDGNAAQ